MDVASSQHNAAVIIEFGSAFIRAGLAGESTPRHIMETKQLFLPAAGRSHNPSRSNLSVKKWEGMLYPLMSNILIDQLHVKSRSRRVVIVEPFISPDAFRSALCRVLLNWMNVPCVLFVSGSMVTVPYALGMNGGLVVDVGRWEGRIACLTKGRYLTDSFQAVPCGFENLADSLMLQLNQENPGSITSVEDAISILLQCFDKPGFAVGERSGAFEFNVPSTGQTGTMPADILHDCLHDMFFDASNPESLLHALLTCLTSCPVDLRVSMLRNISLVGGGVAGIPDFERTLLKSILALFDPADESESSRFETLAAAVNKQGSLGIIYPLPFAPQLISWVGGSIVGTLGLSDERWVFRQSFMEQEEKAKLSGESNGSSGIYDFLAASS